MLAKRTDVIGVADITACDLHHTFVSDLLVAGAAISTVAKLAGHIFGRKQVR